MIETVEELSDYFRHKITKLEITAHVLSGVEAEEYKNLSEGLEHDLSHLERYTKHLQSCVHEQNQQLEHLQSLKTQTTQIIEHLQHALWNIPQNLPTREVRQNSSCNSNAVKIQECSKLQQAAEPVVETNSCRFLQFLTVDDFESIPKYMKGRMSYDKINSVIKQLDNVFTEKYKILKQKKSTLNDINRKRYEAFKLQENKNTKGQPFIVERDILDFSTLKMDNATRNILTILRHFSLIHEIRGDGFVRFASYAGY